LLNCIIYFIISNIFLINVKSILRVESILCQTIKLPGTSFGGEGGGAVGWICPPWIWEIVIFLCFCSQHFFFFSYFVPPRKLVKIVPLSPLKKTEMASLKTSATIYFFLFKDRIRDKIHRIWSIFKLINFFDFVVFPPILEYHRSLQLFTSPPAHHTSPVHL